MQWRFTNNGSFPVYCVLLKIYFRKERYLVVATNGCAKVILKIGKFV